MSARLGRGEPEWVLTEFAALIEQLEAGRFDVIAAGMFITEERAGRVAFSRVTGRVRPGLLVERGNPHGLHTYADAVARAGVRLAVLEGSVEERTLLKKGLPAERLMVVPDAVSGLALLKTRRVDGLALSQPTVGWMAEQADNRDEVEAASPFTPPQDAGEGRVAFSFRRGDGRLRRAWDEALAEFLQSDEHRRIAKQFGFETDALTTEGAR